MKKISLISLFLALFSTTIYSMEQLPNGIGIIYKVNDYLVSEQCRAAAIDNNHILTSLHCINNKENKYIYSDEKHTTKPNNKVSLVCFNDKKDMAILKLQYSVSNFLKSGIYNNETLFLLNENSLKECNAVINGESIISTNCKPPGGHSGSPWLYNKSNEWLIAGTYSAIIKVSKNEELSKTIGFGYKLKEKTLKISCNNI